MGDFREQLLKAGLVTPEQVKQAEAPPKPPPRPPARDGGGRDGGGRDGRDGRDGRGRDGPRRGSNDARSARDANEPALPAPGDAAAVRALAQAGRLDGKFRGGRRWYYVSRRGTVPYLELNDDGFARLESGAAGLVESPSGETWLVDGPSARALRDDETHGGRDWVRAWAGR